MVWSSKRIEFQASSHLAAWNFRRSTAGYPRVLSGSEVTAITAKATSGQDLYVEQVTYFRIYVYARCRRPAAFTRMRESWPFTRLFIRATGGGDKQRLLGETRRVPR